MTDVEISTEEHNWKPPSVGYDLTVPTSNDQVYLRAFRLSQNETSDLHDMYVIRSQIEVMEHSLQGRPDRDMDETKGVLEKMLQKNREGNGCIFAIVYKNEPDLLKTGIERHQVIGSLGIHKLEESSGEIGYRLQREFWGQGIATAVVKAFMNFWWTQTASSTASNGEISSEGYRVPEIVTAEIVDYNLASQRVMQKCGFVLARTWEEDDILDPTRKVNVMLFSCTRPDETQ